MVPGRSADRPASGVSMQKPRVSFGMIVLNGEPFTRYSLRSIYPFAHEIVVVEGACRGAAAWATPDGHSLDGTLEVLRRFQQENDPARKLRVVTAEDEGHANGFWPEKDEMSRAYARRVTGNFLWQIDSDEFYLEEDMRRVVQLLEQGVDAISFPTLLFWGGLDYVVTGFRMICDRYQEFHRLFAWAPGYSYHTHRPPTVLDADGVDLRKKRWYDYKRTARLGIRMFHYTFLFPHQVQQKACYYSTGTPEKLAQGGVIEDADLWAERTYQSLEKPYHVDICQESLSWLERYCGPHPDQVRALMGDVTSGKVRVTSRGVADIEELLRRPSYRIGRCLLSVLAKTLAKPGLLPVRHYSLAALRHVRNGEFFHRTAEFLKRRCSSGWRASRGN